MNPKALAGLTNEFVTKYIYIFPLKILKITKNILEKVIKSSTIKIHIFLAHKLSLNLSRRKDMFFTSSSPKYDDP